MVELTRSQCELVINQLNRKCSYCNFDLEPFSTTCIKCGTHNKLTKVIEGSWYEHYEMKKCEKHDTQVHYCIHPKKTSTLEELQTICLQCCIDRLDDLKNANNKM